MISIKSIIKSYRFKKQNIYMPESKYHLQWESTNVPPAKHVPKPHLDIWARFWCLNSFSDDVLEPTIQQSNQLVAWFVFIDITNEITTIFPENRLHENERMCLNIGIAIPIDPNHRPHDNNDDKASNLRLPYFRHAQILYVKEQHPQKHH